MCVMHYAQTLTHTHTRFLCFVCVYVYMSVCDTPFSSREIRFMEENKAQNKMHVVFNFAAVGFVFEWHLNFLLRFQRSKELIRETYSYHNQIHSCPNACNIAPILEKKCISRNLSLRSIRDGRCVV